MEVTVRYVCPIAPDAYWQTLYSSRPFIESLYTDGLGGTDLQISEWESADDGAFSRTLSFDPKMDAPAAVKKVLGNRFRCEERGRFDPKRQVWTYQYSGASMAKKIAIHGEQHTVPHAEGCEVVIRMNVVVSIFGVGRLVEKTIVAQFRTDMQAQAAFVRRWIAEHND